MEEKKGKKSEKIALKKVKWVLYVCYGIAAAVPQTAFGTGGDPLTVVNNLSDFIFALIRAIGIILLGLGIMQVGLSLKSHDPSQRANVRPDLGAVKVVTL